MNLIRKTFRFLHGAREKNSAVERLPQSYSCGNAALQMCNYAANGLNAAIFHGDVAGYNQCNSNYPVQVGQSRSVIEVNHWEGYRGHLNIGYADLQYASIKSINNLSHGRHTLLLKARFGRSWRAFVNAWRAA